MYRLFYNYKVTGDVLYIVYDPASYPDKTLKDGDVVALFKNDRLIGINIFGISEVVKLRTDGMIVTPEDALIDVVNTILSRAHLEKLAYCRDSGYKVGKIVSLEEHPLDEKAKIVHLDFGSGHLVETFSHYPNLEVGDLLVAALDGTIRFDGTLFRAGAVRNIGHDADICSPKELRVGDDFAKAFKAKEGYKPGDDFYLGGQ